MSKNQLVPRANPTRANPRFVPYRGVVRESNPRIEVRVFRDREWDEWQARVFVGRKEYKPGSYHTNDREDANATAAVMVSTMKSHAKNYGLPAKWLAVSRANPSKKKKAARKLAKKYGKATARAVKKGWLTVRNNPARLVEVPEDDVFAFLDGRKSLQELRYGKKKAKKPAAKKPAKKRAKKRAKPRSAAQKAATKRMLAARKRAPKKRRAAKRKNPITTKTSKRRLTPERCPRPLASKLLRDIKTAKKRHSKRPRRYGNCAVPSAQYALRFGSKGNKFKAGRQKRHVVSRAKGERRPKSVGLFKQVISWLAPDGKSWVDWWY